MDPNDLIYDWNRLPGSFAYAGAHVELDDETERLLADRSWEQETDLGELLPSAPTAEQIGLIGTHWSKGWIIENNEISHSMNTGITLGRYDLVKRHGVPLPPATAPGFVRSVELALEDGWGKDKIALFV